MNNRLETVEEKIEIERGMSEPELFPRWDLQASDSHTLMSGLPSIYTLVDSLRIFALRRGLANLRKDLHAEDEQELSSEYNRYKDAWSQLLDRGILMAISLRAQKDSRVKISFADPNPDEMEWGKKRGIDNIGPEVVAFITTREGNPPYIARTNMHSLSRLVPRGEVMHFIDKPDPLPRRFSYIVHKKNLI